MSQTATDSATDTRLAIDWHEAGVQGASRRANALNNSAVQGLRQALACPRYEIIPMRGALAQARKLPAGATVTVTCSPSRGVAPTVELAEQIQALGHVAVPHLAARRFQSRAQLAETLARLTAAGVRDVFVIGGDGKDRARAFACGADLIAAIAELQPDLRSVGIPCYPEGHAFIAGQVLDEALDSKCFHAGHMVTQICFDTGRIGSWLARVRGRGVDLPVYIGIPGVIERRKLLGIALRIGLGDSTRFIQKNGGFAGRLAGPARFTPDALIDGLAATLAEDELGVAGIHINTFNQVEATETWRRHRLSTLAATANDDPRAAAAGHGPRY